jgi:signal transduction histidine kinase/PAS domain-containing protein
LEDSVRTEQEILDELRALRARVVDLEQGLAHMQLLTQEPDNTSVNAQKLSDSFSTDDGGTPQVNEQVIALEVVFETITDGLAVYDQLGNIVKANSAFYRLFDISSRETFNSQSLYERGQELLMTDNNGKPFSQEHWPASRVLRGEVIDHGKPTDVTFLTMSKRQIQTAISGAPIHDQEGNIDGAVIVFHDITLRKAVERRTNDVLNTLLDMAEILVQGTDQSTTDKLRPASALDPVLQRLLQLGQRVLHYAQAGILLIDEPTTSLHPITIMGKSIPEMQQWQSRLATMTLTDAFPDEQMLSSLHSGQVVKASYPRSDVPENEASYLLVPILAGTKLIGLLSLDYGQDIHDLSPDELVLTTAVSKLVALILEREQLVQEWAASQANELALQEANRRMDEFLSIASHELRTPLTTINGNIQLAKRRVQTLPLPADASPILSDKVALIEELLNRAERQVRVQNRMVGDLLDVSRIQADRLDLNMDRYDLAVIIREAVEDQRSSSAGRIIVSHDILENLQIHITIDADRIAQVITNFLTNALKYSAPDQPVEVYLETNNDIVRVFVRDTGPGIPLDEQEKLWERFYRVPGIVIQSGSGIGLGLGLHICRTIIEHHGGHVGVQSSPGQGSTFWFSLSLT